MINLGEASWLGLCRWLLFINSNAVCGSLLIGQNLKSWKLFILMLEQMCTY